MPVVCTADSEVPQGDIYSYSLYHLLAFTGCVGTTLRLVEVLCILTRLLQLWFPPLDILSPQQCDVPMPHWCIAQHQMHAWYGYFRINYIIGLQSTKIKFIAENRWICTYYMYRYVLYAVFRIPYPYVYLDSYYLVVQIKVEPLRNGVAIKAILPRGFFYHTVATDPLCPAQSASYIICHIIWYTCTTQIDHDEQSTSEYYRTRIKNDIYYR